MPITELDLALYESISALIREQRRDKAVERRDSKRYSYRCVQLMAPYDGENLPEQKDLRPVLCHDLSPHGFSFLAPDMPERSQVVIALGRVPLKFFIAQIVRMSPMASEQGHEFQIGCRFVRRIMAE